MEKNAKSDAIARVESKETQNSIDLKANGDQNRRQELQDSLLKAYESQYLYTKANEKIFLGYTYRQCQAREINLGLDLKGGMNVMLEVSTVDVVRALANNTDDSVFNKAIAMAIANQKTTTNRDFVTLFYEAIREINPDVQLAPYFNTQLRDRIKLNDDNDAVIKVVKEEAASAYDRTYEILRQRIDKFGVAQPTIQQLRASERILVELPGVKDPKRVEKLLQGTAQLEFWLTYDNAEALQMLEKADQYIASIGVSGTVETEEVEENEPAVADAANEGDSLLNALATNEEKVNDVTNDSEHPLFNENMLMPNVGPNGTIVKGPVVGYAAAKNRDAISEMLALAYEKKALPSSVKFLWGAKPINESSDMYELYAIRITTRDGSALLDGGVITDARQDFSNNGGNEISMTMNNEGAREWKRITGDNIGRCVAIVLDDLVYSAPTVQNEISGGRSSITGQFTLEEAKDLANILKSGKLPAPAIIVQEEVVGPSLGQESINRGLISFILAFIVVLIYMVIFYNRGGWISVVALITNIFLLMGVLASVGAVLTMPGIAGIVLTLAMAVDGNVIIYERIKEELRAGASIANAVTTGFKNAYSAIIDGQVTTFLLGLVLIMFGSGPVQGFAVTLCIGIATSLFTSIFITRLCIDSRLNHKKTLSFSFPFSENFMRNAHVDFIGKRKTFYIIAGVAIIICLTGLFTRKLNPGIDFTGGRTYVVRFDKPVNAVDVRAALTTEFGDAPEVRPDGGDLRPGVPGHRRVLPLHLPGTFRGRKSVFIAGGRE
ncbi:MAG: protein translocase subunit SecD [Bacteroidales bacterium]|nr:protein translocase subunit SecD [Bacteroidales bacterium]